MARPRKTLSQNFLRDPAVVHRLVRSSALPPDHLWSNRARAKGC